MARCAMSTSTSTMRSPLRFRSMVIAVSTPKPRASGRAASKAARVRQRWPFSGWAGVQPVARLMPGAGQPDHEAVPAELDPVGEDRDRHVRRRPRRPARSAGPRSPRSAPGRRRGTAGGAGRPPVALRRAGGPPRRRPAIAAALPWFLRVPPHRAPASLATRTVASVEPSLDDHDDIDAGQRAARRSRSRRSGRPRCTPGMTTATGGMRPMLVRNPSVRAARRRTTAVPGSRRR